MLSLRRVGLWRLFSQSESDTSQSLSVGVRENKMC